MAEAPKRRTNRLHKQTKQSQLEQTKMPRQKHSQEYEQTGRIKSFTSDEKPFKLPKTKKQIEYEKSYKKEVARIKRQKKALEKRGYNVKNVKIPKKLSEAKKYTLDKIYEKATYTKEDGSIITGSERRKEERIISSRKSAETRKFRKRLKEQPNVAGTPRKQISELPKMEDIIIDNILDLLNRLEYGDTSWRQTLSGKIFTSPPSLQNTAETARLSLVQLLQDQIREYGTNAVARHLEEQARYEDIIAIVNAILHGWYRDEYTSINMVQSNYQKLASMISGKILTEEQIKQWADYDAQEEGFFVGD